MPHERVGDSAEVRAATEAGHHDVRIFPGHLHLLFGFQSYDGLVQADMVQDGSEGVLAVRGTYRKLYGLGNRTSKGSLIVRICRDDVLSGPCGH